MKSLRIIAICGVVLAVSSCGVPEDSKPRSIPSNEVLYDLLAPSTTQAPTTLPSQSVEIAIFLMSSDRLIEVQRKIASPSSLGLVLSALAQGPTDFEFSEGMRTAVNPQVIVGSQIEGDVAVINVSEAFSTSRVEDQIIALAQIVFTATVWEGVEKVRIQLNGMPVEIPRGDGSTTLDPLVRADYEKFAPST